MSSRARGLPAGLLALTAITWPPASGGLGAGAIGGIVAGVLVMTGIGWMMWRWRTIGHN
jgi:hypothetical protein